jgi:hypothetical protein
MSKIMAHASSFFFDTIFLLHMFLCYVSLNLWAYVIFFILYILLLLELSTPSPLPHWNEKGLRKCNTGSRRDRY